MYSAFYVWAELVSLGSLNRASICARAAVNALVGIDNVLAVLLADSLNRALLSASAASDAIISNLVCHCDTSVSCCGYIVSQIYQKENRFCKKSLKNYKKFLESNYSVSSEVSESFDFFLSAFVITRISLIW